MPEMYASQGDVGQDQGLQVRRSSVARSCSAQPDSQPEPGAPAAQEWVSVSGQVSRPKQRCLRLSASHLQRCAARTSGSSTC